MGLSRRQFTKEFKLAAVRRLEQGVSIAEAARGLEVSPNVLHRWRHAASPSTMAASSPDGRWRLGLCSLVCSCASSVPAAPSKTGSSKALQSPATAFALDDRTPAAFAALHQPSPARSAR